MNRISRQTYEKLMGLFGKRNEKAHNTQTGPSKISADVRRAKRKAVKAARKASRGSNRGQKRN